MGRSKKTLFIRENNVRVIPHLTILKHQVKEDGVMKIVRDYFVLDCLLRIYAEKRWLRSFWMGFMLFLWGGVTTSSAQPSGGPYGPLHQSYPLPEVKGMIYYAAPDGKAESSGTSLEQPTSLEAAIERVKTGDAIILRGGIYRTGDLRLNQGILLQPYQDEQPILKGTYIANTWQNLGNGLWTTRWTRLFPSKPAHWWRRDREGKKTPLHRFNNDMVFVDGKFLQSAGWEGEVDEEHYYIDYESGKIYIGINPNGRLVEITAFDAAIIRTTKNIHGKHPDRKGLSLRGITFTQYAYRAIEIEGTEPEGVAQEKDFGKDVVGTTLEHCTISFCSRVAAYLRGDSLTIRHCRISDTSTEGIYIIASNDVLLEKNIFMRNNIETISGYYPAAVKIFNQCHRVTCRDNLVIDLPHSNGIWYDVGNVDGYFINNWVQDVGNYRAPLNIEQPWPSENGFFFEISKGCICAGNVFVNCDHGLWILNSCNAQIYNNTFVNSTACISRNARSAAGDHFGWHPSTGPEVDAREGHVFVNNILYGDAEYDRLLLYVWQPADLCRKLPRPQLRHLDHNLYVNAKDTLPILLWSPAETENCRDTFISLELFRQIYVPFAEHCQYSPERRNPLFRSLELGHLQLLPLWQQKIKAAIVPEEVKKLLGHSQPYVGAYPPGEYE